MTAGEARARCRAALSELAGRGDEDVCPNFVALAVNSLIDLRSVRISAPDVGDRDRDRFLVGQDIRVELDGKPCDFGLLTEIRISPIKKNEIVMVSLDVMPTA